MTKAIKDLGCGIALVLFSAFIFIFSFSIRELNTATYDISSRVFPRICAALLLLLGVLLIVDNVRKIAKLKAEHASAEAAVKFQFDKLSTIRIAATIIALVLFVFFLDKAGFIICGTLLQFVLMVVLAPPRARRKKDIAFYFVISVAFAVLIDWLFIRVFRLMLPGGILSF